MLAEYATALKLLVDALDLNNFTLAVQGFFVPAALQFAKNNEETVKQLILINPPVSQSSNFLHKLLIHLT